MNPIVRMMKRYINMPLRYALPLLFISALVLSATTGCVKTTDPTTNQADITSYPQAGQHSRLIEAFVEQNKPAGVNDQPYDVRWLNNTTAQLTVTMTSMATQSTTVTTYAHFPSIEAATSYFYSRASAYPKKDPYMTYLPHYDLVTGHDPTVVRGLEADASHLLYQTDDVVTMRNTTYITINQA